MDHIIYRLKLSYAVASDFRGGREQIHKVCCVATVVPPKDGDAFYGCVVFDGEHEGDVHIGILGEAECVENIFFEREDQLGALNKAFFAAAFLKFGVRIGHDCDEKIEKYKDGEEIEKDVECGAGFVEGGGCLGDGFVPPFPKIVVHGGHACGEKAGEGLGGATEC